MANIDAQVHNHFKVFAGTLGPDNDVTAMSQAVSDWAKSSGAAAKSIGVEYLEGTKNLVLSIGYRTDEAPYGIALKAVPLGRIEKLDDAGVAALEAKMGGAAAGIANIICHELFVTESHDYVMVFLTHA